MTSFLHLIKSALWSIIWTVKPVLNWANVCSTNILRTVRRTMIRFLIELIVRRTWFGQSKLYFVLNWLVMRCNLRPELAADAQQTAWSKMQPKVKSIYFNHPSQGHSTKYCLRDKAAPPTSQQINKFPPKRVKNLAKPSIFIFIFIFLLFIFLHPQESSALSQSEAMFVEKGECSQNMLSEALWTFVAVRRILPTGFAKKSSPIKSQLGSPNTSN